MKDHQAVRLKQGRMEDAVVYSNSVFEMACSWIDQGAERLHLVDLNGAFAGKPIHFDDITKIAKAYPDIETQVGGGIRNLETLQAYFNAGVTYAILGTAAVKNPELVFQGCNAFPGRIIIGVDAKDGMVATEGWGSVSQVHITEVLDKFKDCDIEALIYTDISKDGMLSGMNSLDVQAIRDYGYKVIASGGLASLEDIEELKEAGGIYGVIAGTALYENRFSLADAIALAKRAEP